MPDPHDLSDEIPDEIPDDDEDSGGYDVDDWSRLVPFTGRVATLEDVQARRAVFALDDTDDPRPIAMDLPQPLIWWDDEAAPEASPDAASGSGVAAVAVQAETHLNSDGEEMEVLGLILPDGGAAVALLEDVDLVDDTDPTWRELVAAAVGAEDGEPG